MFTNGKNERKLKIFKEKVYKLAEEIGVEIKELHFREMKRKWASCSSKGRITFDKSLLDEPNEKIKEVVLHELLHLRYPVHNKMFKLLLKAYTLQKDFDL